MAEVEKKNITSQSVLYDRADQKLILFFVIVNSGLGSIYKQIFIDECGVNYVLTFQGRGTATKEMYKMLGLSQVKKEVIVAIAPETKINDLMYAAREQFVISRRTKGVAFAVELDSIINLKVYNYLIGKVS